MTVVDQLIHVHSVARAQAVEDFEFFATTVLGLRIEPTVCDQIQRAVERNQPLRLEGRAQLALTAWLAVIGRAGPLSDAPTETFQWLFGAYVAVRRAA